MRSGEYYSKGKLLFSGEYLVLYGAKALAAPLKYGQRMLVAETSEPGILHWETYVLDKLWFSAGFNLRDMKTLHCSDENTAFFIRKLLKEGGNLQPALKLPAQGFFVRNYIDFDLNWGMGSSSSLVSNFAFWLDIDLFTLYKALFKGSGYDVFCARANSPVIYQLKENKPEIVKVALQSAVTDSLYFIYLGRKQDSQESVERFREKPSVGDHLISQVSILTEKMTNAVSPNDFMKIMRKHEEALSKILHQPMVKEKHFPDFNGEVKSLGAWGGDFIMACTTMSPGEVSGYFLKKGYTVIFQWNEIIY